MLNLNTTIVKVKLFFIVIKRIVESDLNTTIVKVKLP